MLNHCGSSDSALNISVCSQKQTGSLTGGRWCYCAQRANPAKNYSITACIFTARLLWIKVRGEGSSVDHLDFNTPAASAMMRCWSLCVLPGISFGVASSARHKTHDLEDSSHHRFLKLLLCCPPLHVFSTVGFLFLKCIWSCLHRVLCVSLIWGKACASGRYVLWKFSPAPALLNSHLCILINHTWTEHCTRFLKNDGGKWPASWNHGFVSW